MRKRVKKGMALACAAALTALMPLSAMAQSAACPVDNCYRTTEHAHNGTTYAGHYAGDGHTYHRVCDVADCTKTGSHRHDGANHLPHAAGDGHGYHDGTNHSANARHKGQGSHH